MATRVIIIENDETWRFIYYRQLRDAQGVVVIAEFERAEEALQQIPQLLPDVAIVDISLPGMSGLEFAERMREYLALRTILITSHQEEFLAKYNQLGFLVIDKGDTKALLEGLTSAVAK